MAKTKREKSKRTMTVSITDKNGNTELLGKLVKDKIDKVPRIVMLKGKDKEPVVIKDVIANTGTKAALAIRHGIMNTAFYIASKAMPNKEEDTVTK